MADFTVFEEPELAADATLNGQCSLTMQSGRGGCSVVWVAVMAGVHGMSVPELVWEV